MSMTRTRTLLSCAALALGSTALIGCAGMSSASPATPAASAVPSASTGSSASTVRVAAPSTPASTPRSGGSAATHDDSDSYAYTHACSKNQLSVRVVRRAAAASQRVIEVRNLGANSCGLSYYPLVSVGDPNAADHTYDIKPLIPGGLGGPPAYALHTGKTAYAVIDLDPSGKAPNASQGGELNVLAHSDMPNADTLNFPLGSNSRVLKPKLGLYEDNVNDAVASMNQATVQS
ncbi:DUF4232 domain-containing protein [Streptomyces sp. NBC_00536]|uniref:DUF4232 domain-containing protein n=1 Tax=Streptomyces sp. NBC_00536 TaxID=2975769 RepID=UPI002E80B14A|nr:DUF4232 domain-containing protein [Streptomyces sp. NBC_00536]WUC79637.1 DUF4232 domain-containing protein [Streptomyces sp. NBC_00536]